MKPRSMKLRTFITLHTLFKHTDKDHRLNTVKLNEFLKPYNLECTGRALSDTVRIMREYGIDVRNKGEWDNQGVWIEDRPLSETKLERLIFAVSTNPHLSQSQANEILGYLKPLVTVYEEEKLCSIIDTKPDLEADDALFATYYTIKEAIRLQRRVVYTTKYIKYNKETHTIGETTAWGTLFTPYSLHQVGGRLYVFGYNNTDRKIQSLNIENITDIKIAFKHQTKRTAKAWEKLCDVDARDYIPEERKTVIYSGPLSFVCRGQFVEDIYARFGAPSEPIVKNERCKAVYTLSDAEITPQTLLWLSEVQGHGISVKGPQEAIESIQAYVSETIGYIASGKV